MIHQLYSYMLVVVVEGSSVCSCILLVAVCQPVHIIRYVSKVCICAFVNLNDILLPTQQWRL